MLNEEIFNCVIMDYQMPVTDQYVTTRQTQKLVNTIPIVAFISDTILREKKKCIDAVIFDYASKPFKIKELSFFLDHSIS
jgi:CheY-like chemotaxis protein